MPVTIIAHRGWWKTPEEQNTLPAFARAFDAGIGVELDVRDWERYLVVAHDPPSARAMDGPKGDRGLLRFQEVCDLLSEYNGLNVTLAVNVKSCGLAPWFAKVEPRPKNWFFFDAAPGDDEEYHRLNLPLKVRRTSPGSDDESLIISNEVFGLDYGPQWYELRKYVNSKALLVTDKVSEAAEFFRVKLGVVK